MTPKELYDAATSAGIVTGAWAGMRYEELPESTQSAIERALEYSKPQHRWAQRSSWDMDSLCWKTDRATRGE